MKWLSRLIPLLLVAVCVTTSFAAEGEVIGQTSVFHLVPSSVLIANDPGEVAGVQAFNYFFCIELFVGLFAAWLRMFLGLFKKEVP